MKPIKIKTEKRAATKALDLENVKNIASNIAFYIPIPPIYIPKAT